MDSKNQNSGRDTGKNAPPLRLPLRTEGELVLVFVGAGSAFSKKFYQNNLFIVKGEERILVDCGTRAPEALTQLGTPVTEIGAFLITHSHADHIGGLEEVMLMNRYVARRKPTIILPEKLKTILWTMSLQGGCSHNEVHDGKALEFEDFWNPIYPKRIRGGDRELALARLGEIEITFFRTKHIPDSAAGWDDSFPSYGIIIDGRILFSSDSRYDPEMVLYLEKKYKLEAIYHDCQLYKGGVHASLEELAALPQEIRAKTHLMHYGDRIDDFRDRIRELGFAGVVEEWKNYGFEKK